jgi:hypothetical protein
MAVSRRAGHAQGRALHWIVSNRKPGDGVYRRNRARTLDKRKMSHTDYQYRNSTATNDGSTPSGVMRHGVSHLAKDVAALAELQAELLKVELRDWLQKCLTPVVVLAVVSAIAALASLPVLLMSLAYCLNEFAGLSMALSALIAGAVGLAIAAACLFAAWRVLKRQRGAFTRFKVELVRNTRWLKQVLTRPSAVADDEPW